MLIFQDVVAVKEAYEDVWTGLDVSEQEQIINESIIRPDAILRYEGRVSVQGVKSLGDHFACLCRRFDSNAGHKTILRPRPQEFEFF